MNLEHIPPPADPTWLWRQFRTSAVGKLVALCLVATFAALTTAFTAFQWQDWHGDVADLKANEIAIGQQIAPLALRGARDHDAASLLAAAWMARGDDDTVSVAWFPAGGGVVPVMRRGASAQDMQFRPVSTPVATYQNGHIWTRIPWTEHGRYVGQLALQADDEDVNQTLIRNTLAVIPIILLATVLAGVIAFLLARRTLRPLKALDRGMDAIQADGDFSRRLEIGPEDEIGRLTNRFNGLLAHLEGYDQRQRQMVEELTSARDSAEEANVMKSQFLANMSHEIRTPLNGVLAMAQVMEMNPLSKTQRRHLQVIRESGEALLAVLNDLLDLSKIEAGRLELESAPFEIEDTAAGARAAFTAIANEKGVSFGFEVRDAALGQWEGDSVRVRQILYNLIANALKFTEAGEIRVVVDGVPKGAGRKLVITVADTGIGIALDVLPKLFRKFVQGDSSITRRFGGTGLGLTICRQLAELMGGGIEVSSVLGKGTTFEVVLPLRWLGPSRATGQAAAPGPAAVAKRDLSSLRVLAAEDNPTNRLVLQTILHALGVSPEIVGDGRAAVDRWQKSSPDLILMDIQMPIMDGVGATQEIRALEARRGLSPTPIVALSANAMKHQVAEYLAAGMDGHLAKPIQLEKLHAVLTEALEMSQERRTAPPALRLVSKA